MNIYEQRIFFFFYFVPFVSRWYPHHLVIIGRDYTVRPQKRFSKKNVTLDYSLVALLNTVIKERKWFCRALDSGRVFYHGQKRISKPMTTMDCFWFSSQLKEIKGPLGFIYEILSHLIFSVIPYKEKMNESAAGTKCGWRPITADTKLIVTCCCNFSRAIKMNFNTRKKKEKQEKGKNFNKC